MKLRIYNYSFLDTIHSSSRRLSPSLCAHMRQLNLPSTFIRSSKLQTVLGLGSIFSATYIKRYNLSHLQFIFSPQAVGPSFHYRKLILIGISSSISSAAYVHQHSLFSIQFVSSPLCILKVYSSLAICSSSLLGLIDLTKFNTIIKVNFKSKQNLTFSKKQS